MVCKYAVIALYNNLFWNETTMLLHKESKDKLQIERTQREKINTTADSDMLIKTCNENETKQDISKFYCEKILSSSGER